jgi:hypothetical protein
MFQGVFTQQRFGEETLPLAKHQLHNSFCREWVQIQVNITVCLRSVLIPRRLNRVIIYKKKDTEESAEILGELRFELLKPNVSEYRNT